MSAPDIAFVRWLWSLIVALLTTDDKVSALIPLLIVAAIAATILRLVYTSWFKPLYLFTDDTGGQGRSELGRVAWVIGLRHGLLQRIWHRHGWYCHREPRAYRHGYHIAAIYLIGALFLFSMNYWRIIIQVWFDLPSAAQPDWGAPWPTMPDSPGGLLAQATVGIAARLFVALALWWSLKTWVLRGWPMTRHTDHIPGIPSHYAPLPGRAPQSLPEVDWASSQALPIKHAEIGTNEQVKIYYWPKGRRGKRTDPAVLVISDAARLEIAPGGFYYHGASHTELRERLGYIYRVPCNDYLETIAASAEAAGLDNDAVMQASARDVEKAVRMSAEAATREAREDNVTTTPPAVCFEPVERVERVDLSEAGFKAVYQMLAEYESADREEEIGKRNKVFRAINQKSRELFGEVLAGTAEPGSSLARVKKGTRRAFIERFTRRLESQRRTLAGATY